MLGNLDNEVIFKKAFTNKFVLQCFVKDMFGIDFEPYKIETEKRFKPKIAHIDFKYDIFAQSKDQRVIVEIQKVDYDYNFDRFLLYHNMAIAEMQRKSDEYKTDKTVYTIVVFTNKYTAKDKDGDAIEHDVLVHNSNLFTLDNQEVNLFGHKLICLNHCYLKNSTPKIYRDWMQLVVESIKNPANPHVNLGNHGIRKVTELIEYDNLTPEELSDNKIKNATASAKLIYEEFAKKEGLEQGLAKGLIVGKEQGLLEGKLETAKNAILAGADDVFIEKITGLSFAQIQDLRK